MAEKTIYPDQQTGGTRAPAGVPEELAKLAREVAQMPAETVEQAVNPLAQDPQLIQEFLVEAREHLAQIEGHLIDIEAGTSNQETLHGVFRSFHTIKGLAGFLDFVAIQEVAHEVETLLDKARNSELKLTPPRVDVVLASGDYIGHWLDYVEASSAGQPAAAPAERGPLVERVKAAMLEQDVEAGPAEAAAGSEAAEADTEVPAAGKSQSSRTEAAVVKVATPKLEYLVDMVGELVIAQSMLKHNPDLTQVKTPRLQRDIAQLARVTAEVQKTAMAMRMVPVGQLFRKMARLVRDLARKSGKRAELEIIGEEVELDRTLVEQLADPLVHMIRNSMDHGLETVAERKAAGKPAAGKLRLRAAHLAGQIVIEVSDDGRGLNRDKILAKAVSRGLVQTNANLSDQEVYHQIFQPGFSTADKVTDVSGRGVGMDVVRKHVEKLRGRIEIESKLGHGTVFQLKLPLTLAIIEGLVLMSGGERFILPIFAVREMFRPSEETIFTVERKGEMALVREHLLPVVRLARKLGLTDKGREPGDGLMIVAESEGRNFCLLVDEMVGKQEVVIKSLGPAFERVRGISGGAILGDGKVGLILDVAALFEKEGKAAA